MLALGTPTPGSARRTRMETASAAAADAGGGAMAMTEADPCEYVWAMEALWPVPPCFACLAKRLPARSTRRPDDRPAAPLVCRSRPCAGVRAHASASSAWVDECLARVGCGRVFFTSQVRSDPDAAGREPGRRPGVPRRAHQADARDAPAVGRAHHSRHIVRTHPCNASGCGGRRKPPCCR